MVAFLSLSVVRSFSIEGLVVLILEDTSECDTMEYHDEFWLFLKRVKSFPKLLRVLNASIASFAHSVRNIQSEKCLENQRFDLAKLFVPKALSGGF